MFETLSCASTRIDNTFMCDGSFHFTHAYTFWIHIIKRTEINIHIHTFIHPSY